jgi:hypothetical protein
VCRDWVQVALICSPPGQASRKTCQAGGVRSAGLSAAPPRSRKRARRWPPACLYARSGLISAPAAGSDQRASRAAHQPASRGLRHRWGSCDGEVQGLPRPATPASAPSPQRLPLTASAHSLACYPWHAPLPNHRPPSAISDLCHSFGLAPTWSACAVWCTALLQSQTRALSGAPHANSPTAWCHEP